MKSRMFVMSALVVALTLAFAAVIPASAASSVVIDFEGLAEGAIVSSLSSGNGISGDPVAGSVSVFGLNPLFGAGTNAAMIFDATCNGGCTGGDIDLAFPDQGNILILSEDLDSTDPDDADLWGSRYEFDFSSFGPGTVTVSSITLMDAEGEEPGAQALLFAGGALLTTVALPITGNNLSVTVPIGVAGVDFMRIKMNGSGAIDNIRLESDEPPPPDTTPPSCEYANTAPGQYTFTIQDLGSGVSVIEALTQANVTTNPALPYNANGTNDPVILTASRADQYQDAALQLKITDVAGNILDSAACGFALPKNPPPPPPSQGCTPGYWKQTQHFGSWREADAVSPLSLTPSTKISAVFVDNPYANSTLLEGLSFPDHQENIKGAKATLLRAAVAAVLNASHPNVSYPREPQAVIDAVNYQLANGSRASILALATTLDDDNNLGCSLGLNP